MKKGLNVSRHRSWPGRIQSLLPWAKKFAIAGAKDERGMAAVMFALSLVVILPLTLGLFDVYTNHEQRAAAQDALDAAALYAARTTYNTSAEIDQVGDAALSANLKLLRGATLVSSDFALTDNNTHVTATATIQSLSLAPSIWANPAIVVSSDVIRNSKNLEVALVLDVTKSMDTNNKIGDLRTAAQQLVDLVVKDQQTPFYSKVAVVPWSNGVNAGAYADQVRGAPTAAKTITAASWATGTAKTITGATKANPVVITSNAHGFANGDKVFIKGVNGMTQLNNKVYTVAGKTTNTFQLSGVNGSSYSNYSAPNVGTVTKCQVATCSLVVTSAAHGFANGTYVVVSSLGGITTAYSSSGGSSHNVNDYVYTVADSTTNSFSLTEAVGASGTYTSGGSASCTNYGCKYYRYTNVSGGIKALQTTNCVSERTGTEAYTDAAPSTAFVGFNYPAEIAVAPYSLSSSFPCVTNEIVPLSTDKNALKTMIGTLTAAGTTAGHVGVAWGWYMVSPNWSYLFPSGRGGASYTQANTLKAVVLMTDGALNTAFCNGVSANTSTYGGDDRINCAPTNGATLDQSLALCQAMKDAKIVVYTVGFEITGDTTAETLMTQCATDANHKYLPTSGSDLSAAFKAIGADLNSLRISH